jgi:hypothetical protein
MMPRMGGGQRVGNRDGDAERFAEAHPLPRSQGAEGKAQNPMRLWIGSFVYPAPAEEFGNSDGLGVSLPIGLTTSPRALVTLAPCGPAGGQIGAARADALHVAGEAALVLGQFLQVVAQRVIGNPQLATGLALVVPAAIEDQARVAAAPLAHRVPTRERRHQIFRGTR